MTFSLDSFRKNLRYSGSPSAARLQADLKKIATQDKKAEKKKKIYIAIAIISAVCAFFAVIWIAETGRSATLPILLIGVAVVTGTLGGRWNRLDVPDVRYSLPARLVDMLGRDMPKGATFETRIDFSNPADKKKKISEEPWPARRGWKQAVFVDPWLFLSGKFLDDTRFVLSMTEMTVVRSGWKRSASGKRKHKKKTKPKGMEAELSLQFSRKRYGAVTALRSDIQSAIALPPGVTLKKVKVNDHQLVLVVKVGPHTLDIDGYYQLWTQMLLSAYQVLNLSKALSKSSA